MNFLILSGAFVQANVMAMYLNSKMHNHAVPYFTETLFSVPVECKSLLFLKPFVFDQSCTIEEGSMYYFFHCSLSLYYYCFGVIFKDIIFTFLTWWNVQRKSIYQTFSSPVMNLEIMQCPTSLRNFGTSPL